MSELSERDDIGGLRARAPVAAVRPARLDLIDAGRGVALAGMVIYHFSWDLTSFGYADFDLFGDPWWLAFRAVILSSFLFFSGLNQQLSHAGGIRYRRAGIRLAKIAAAASAVTVATWWVFPESYVFFGVLHHIAVASLLLVALHRLPAVLWLALAAAAAGLPLIASGGVFDAPWLIWIGLAGYVPLSNDFVPVLPWLAVVAIGAACAPLVLRTPPAMAPLLVWRSDGRVWQFICLMGRHSLLIYLVHQPLLWGGLYLWALIDGL